MKPSKRTVPRWLPAVLCTLGCALLIFLFCLAWFLTRTPDTEAAFTINGIPITAEHEQLYLDAVRSQVTAHYASAYGADPNGEGFWQTEFDGQTPAQYQQALAHEKLVRDTLERALARAHGVETAVTLSEIQSAMDARNQSDGIQYGPTAYGISEFIAQTQTQARDGLMTALLAGELSPTEDDLLGLYSLPENAALLDLGYSASVGVFSYASMSAGQFPDDLTEAFVLAQSLHARQTAPQDILDAVERETGIALDHWEMDFDTDRLQKDDELLPRLAEVCRDVPVGGFSPVWETTLNRGVAVVLDKDDRGKASFEEAKGLLTNRWINTQYERYLQGAVDGAEIQ